MKKTYWVVLAMAALSSCSPVLSGVGTVTGEHVTFTADASAVTVANANSVTIEQPRAFLRGSKDFTPDAALCKPYALGFFCTLASIESGKKTPISYTGTLETGTLRYVSGGTSHVLALDAKRGP